MKRALALALSAVLFASCNKLFEEEPTPQQQFATFMAQGKAAAKAGNWEAAAKAFESAGAFASANDPSPQLALGAAYEKMGNDLQAIMTLSSAVKMAPKNTEAREVLADLYLRHGKPELAADHLRKASELIPDGPSPELQRKLATALLRSGDLDGAENLAQQLDQGSPGDAETQALLAEILIAKGQEERAVRLLDAAVGTNPDSARVRMVRARYFSSRGKVTEALHEYELAYKATPSDAELAMAYARALAGAQRIEDAAEVVQQLLAARPTDLNAQAMLAEVKMLGGEAAEAKKIAEGVIAKHPRNGRALLVRAWAMEQEDPNRAVGAYRKVLEEDPGQSEALGRLYKLYLKRGDKAEAIAALERLQIAGDMTQDDELELDALYADTGINVSRARASLDQILKRDPGCVRCGDIKRELEKKSRATGGGGGSGIQIIKGSRRP